MILIVDANILFSALIKEGPTAKILLNERFDLFAPRFLFEEFENYKETILKKTHRSAEDFDNILSILRQLVTIVPKNELGVFLEPARKLCPDPNDSAYFALALKMNSAIWSNDKALKNQNKIKVYSTKDLLDLISV